MEAMETVIKNVEGMKPAEATQTVIEDVVDLMPTEAAQAVVKAATKKPGVNVVKTGGIIAGIAALVVGIGVVIYSAIKPKKVDAVDETDFEAEPSDDNETDED